MTGGHAIRVADLLVEHPAPGGAIRAVDIADLQVSAGTSVAVMGPSGCGKSTLLGVLAGLASPTAGSVTIGPTTLSELAEDDRVAFRRTVGMVHQADNLLPFLTVEENLRLQLAIADNEASAGPTIDALLERLGLGGLGGRLPDQLSGGQRQRAAVARAVVHQPCVILADEPTGALDEANAAAVVGLLRQASDDVGATLVVVTHDPDVARALGRVVLLRDGTVVDDARAGDAG